MGNILTKRRRRFYGRLKEDRTAAGRQELRNMASQKHLAEVDWPTVIEKADELHRREQRRLRRKEKRWRRRQLRRSKYIRKKYGESAGVYCVNLLSINRDNESFLEDEFDDSYSVYYTFESATMEYITDATASSTFECATAEAASTMEYAVVTHGSSTLEYSTDSSLTLEAAAAEPISFCERCHKTAACRPKIRLSGDDRQQLGFHLRKQKEPLIKRTCTPLGRQKDAIDSSFGDLAMHASSSSHGHLSTLTEELFSTAGGSSDCFEIPPTAVWI